MESKITKQIDDYLNGDLQGIELADFEKRLAKDADLQKELELHKEINKAIMEQDVMELRRKLEARKPSRKFFIRRNLRSALGAASAAAAVILLSIGAFQLFSPKDNNAEKIFYKYYSPENISVSRSAGSDETELFGRAMESYNAKDYSVALTLFTEILNNDSLHIAGNFYMGICNMELKQYNLAGRHFSRVIKYDKNLYMEQAKWHLGLCYHKAGKREKAIEQFRAITKKNEIYWTKAREILNELGAEDQN